MPTEPPPGRLGGPVGDDVVSTLKLAQRPGAAIDLTSHQRPNESDSFRDRRCRRGLRSAVGRRRHARNPACEERHDRSGSGHL